MLRLAWVLFLLVLGGCASIRVTDPQRTATEQFLISQAAAEAIDRLSMVALRGQAVYLDSTYLTAATQPSNDHSFLLGELRAKLLLSGVQLVAKREQAKIIAEVRSGSLGIDRQEYLLGIPAIYLQGGNPTTGQLPLATPELALLKSTKQFGFASVSMVAYWADSGEVVASTGPFVGRTVRQDWWFLGWGPRTIGDIPPAQSAQ